MARLFSSRTGLQVFWWSEPRLMGKEKENYGDLLSKYLVEKISGQQIKWVQPKKQAWYHRNKKNYLTVGSIIHHATKDSIVWGSGIIDQHQQIAPADFRAVRGPRTRKYLLDLGYDCPEVYGDPALLLPLYFQPKVKKKFSLGIIPHYHDYNQVTEFYKDSPDILIIDLMTMDVEAATKQILSCEKTISSSLHGIIVSHAYEIPSIWVKFSEKIFGNDIKYQDYLESVNIPFYKPTYIESRIKGSAIEILIFETPNLPKEGEIKQLQEGLMKSCPFLI